MTAAVNGRVLSRGNSGSMYWTWPQLLAHASRDATLRPGDVLGSGTVGTGLHPRADARGRRRLAPARRRRRADDRTAGDPAQPRRRPSLKRDWIWRETFMPPYLRLGSIPRKRHIAHPQRAGLQGRGDLLRGSGHPRRVLAGLQPRLPSPPADARGPDRAGRDRHARAGRRARRCAIIT